MHLLRQDQSAYKGEVSSSCENQCDHLQWLYLWPSAAAEPWHFFLFYFFFEQCLHDKWLLLVPNRMITIAANLKDSRADAQGTWAVIQSLKRKLHFYLAAWYCQTVCVTFFFLSLLPVRLNKRCDRTQSSSVWSVSSSKRSVKFAHNPVSCDYLRLWWFITVGFWFSLSVSTIF